MARLFVQVMQNRIINIGNLYNKINVKIKKLAKLSLLMVKSIGFKKLVLLRLWTAPAIRRMFLQDCLVCIL
jgi:hypothetical protein